MNRGKNAFHILNWLVILIYYVGAYKDPVRKGYLVEKDFDKKICPQLILPIESILDDKYFVNS